MHKPDTTISFSVAELTVFVVWLGLSVYGILHHALWLDEAHHWMLARDSVSLIDLFHNSRYDGHPLLWESLLFVVAAFSRDPLAMQLTHLCLASIATFLFLRFAPFTLLQKILVQFGYFFLFEYDLISRNYQIGWLLLIITCIVFTRPVRNYLLATIVLVLLANAHLFSSICAVPLFALLVWERRQDKAPGISVTVLVVIFLCGFAGAMAQINPPSDSLFISKHNALPMLSAIRVARSCTIFVKGFFVMPDFSTINIGSTNYFNEHIRILGDILVVAGFIFPACFLSKKISLFIFYCTALTFSLFMYVLPLTATRYMGYVVMIFLVAWWLDMRYEKSSAVIPMLQRRAIKIAGTTVLWLVLLTQTVSGVLAFWYYGCTIPFSEGKRTAEYLQAPHATPVGEIMVMPFHAAPAIDVYLAGPVFSPESGEYRTFCNWNTNSPVENFDIAHKIKETLDAARAPYLTFIMAYSNDKIAYLEQAPGVLFSNAQYAVAHVAVFDTCVMADEKYHVYSLTRKNP